MTMQTTFDCKQEQDIQDQLIPNNSIILQFCTNLKEINQQNDVKFKFNMF